MCKIFIQLSCLFIALQVNAKTLDLDNACWHDAEPDIHINACTALIQSGQLTTKNLSIAYSNRSLGYFDKGLYNQAIADTTQALTLNPTNTFAWYNRGNAYKKNGLYDQAIADYDKTVALNPNFSLAYNSRGGAYSKKGLNDLAIADFTKAIALNGMIKAYYSRARSYYLKCEYKAALSDAEMAVTIEPNIANHFVLRGQIYEQLHQLDKADSDYHAALALDSKNKDAESGLKRIIAASKNKILK